MFLLADPIIMIVPLSDDSSDEWINYHKYLLYCHDIIDREKDKIVISQVCYEALYSSNRYPESMNMIDLQEKLSSSGVSDYDASTLLSNTRYLMQRAKKLEDYLEIDPSCYEMPDGIIIESEPIVLISRDTISIRPEKILFRLKGDDNLEPAFQLTAGLLAYSIEYVDRPRTSTDEMFILTVERLIEEIDEADFKIEVDVTISEKSDQVRNISLQTLLSPKKLLDIYDENTSIVDFITDANKMFNYVCSEDDKQRLMSYRFADDFCQSLIDNHVDKDEEILEKVFKKIKYLLTVADIKDKPPSPPIPSDKNKRLMDKGLAIIDGEWEAWRIHISGQNYRVHYWWHQRDKYFLFSMFTNGHTALHINPNQREKTEIINISSTTL